MYSHIFISTLISQKHLHSWRYFYPNTSINKRPNIRYFDEVGSARVKVYFSTRESLLIHPHL